VRSLRLGNIGQYAYRWGRVRLVDSTRRVEPPGLETKANEWAVKIIHGSQDRRREQGLNTKLRRL